MLSIFTLLTYSMLIVYVIQLRLKLVETIGSYYVLLLIQTLGTACGIIENQPDRHVPT